MSQPTGYKKGHKLTEINADNRTAICKICGEVSIVKSAIIGGKQYYRCRNTFEMKTNKVPYKKEHFLSNINEEDLVATCSKCGETKVHKRVDKKSGMYSWACHGSLMESRSRKKARRAITNPRKIKHRLISFNPETREGVCEICGPISITKRGTELDESIRNAWRCPGSGRDFRINSKYGLKRSDYDTMFEQQEGKCAICNKEWDQKLRVDHCHATGKIRQLLCTGCNTGLGQFQDSPDLLQKAIQYLSSHQLPTCPIT